MEPIAAAVVPRAVDLGCGLEHRYVDARRRGRLADDVAHPIAADGLAGAGRHHAAAVVALQGGRIDAVTVDPDAVVSSLAEAAEFIESHREKVVELP